MAIPAPVRAAGGSVLLRPESLVVAAGDERVVTFDRAGRLYSFFDAGRFYRRGVDGRVRRKHRPRRVLDPAEARSVTARAREAAAGVRPPAGHERDALRRALAFPLDRDAARFRAAYDGPVPILPPDCYRALVLQATIGCFHNACVFCRLYRDRPFRVRGEEEFADHARRVGEAFGDGISMRRGVFLGDADASAVGTARLARFLAVAARLAPARHGVFCFGAASGRRPRPRAEWRELEAGGLRRVHLGVETGDDALRARLGKPGRARDVLHLVASLKEAGIAVGLIFLAGLGGSAHVRASAALCRAADLDGDDFVYLSPLLDARGRPAAEPGLDALRDALDLAPPPRGPRVAVYDLRAFAY